MYLSYFYNVFFQFHIHVIYLSCISLTNPEPYVDADYHDATQQWVSNGTVTEHSELVSHSQNRTEVDTGHWTQDLQDESDSQTVRWTSL